MEEIVLGDIREMAQRIVLDEESIKKEFVRQNAELTEKTVKSAKKELLTKSRRIEELTRMIQAVYEDKVNGKMPEEICFELIETRLNKMETTIRSADDFISDIKKYLNAPTLTREMCYELIDCVVVGGLPKITGKEREIHIVYKVDILAFRISRENGSDKQHLHPARSDHRADFHFGRQNISRRRKL